MGSDHLPGGQWQQFWPTRTETLGRPQAEQQQEEEQQEDPPEQFTPGQPLGSDRDDRAYERRTRPPATPTDCP